MPRERDKNRRKAGKRSLVPEVVAQQEAITQLLERMTRQEQVAWINRLLKRTLENM